MFEQLQTEWSKKKKEEDGKDGGNAAPEVSGSGLTSADRTALKLLVPSLASRLSEVTTQTELNDALGLGTKDQIVQAMESLNLPKKPVNQYKKRMSTGYRYRPNPLGNPRKQYY